MISLLCCFSWVWRNLGQNVGVHQIICQILSCLFSAPLTSRDMLKIALNSPSNYLSNGLNCIKIALLVAELCPLKVCQMRDFCREFARPPRRSRGHIFVSFWTMDLKFEIFPCLILMYLRYKNEQNPRWWPGNHLLIWARMTLFGV